jgi:diacylglycerol kinase family enzyme
MALMTEPVVLVNPASGKGRTPIGELERIFPTCRVEACPPDQLAERVRALRDAGAPFIAVAGGDGTLRTAAEALVGGDVPVLAVPAGTRNHFAKDFRIKSLRDAGAAARAGVTHTIDIGRVNERFFINTSSLGVYPRMVEQRKEHETRWPKPMANAIAAWQQLRRGRRSFVIVDGEEFVTWLVFVGNGRYGENLRDVAKREALDQNVLDVRIVHADQPFARLRLVASLLFGRLTATPVVTRRECRSVTIEVPRRARVAVALDGDVVQLATPLDYESRAGALRVLTPSHLGET